MQTRYEAKGPPETKKPAFAGFSPRAPDGHATLRARISCSRNYGVIFDDFFSNAIILKIFSHYFGYDAQG
jgi:hypothetical protein